MNNTVAIILGITLPFLATTLGASFVLFLKKQNENLQKLTYGFSAGIMLAASFLSLINPAIEMSTQQNVPPFIPVAVGIIIGVLFLMLADFLLNKVINKQKSFLMITAITLHNIPEGMIVGLSLGLAIISPNVVSIASALTLAIGIAIQNIPEGCAVSLPLRSAGYSRKKSFMIGMISGLVEPIGCFIAILLVEVVDVILPYMLTFSAGTMLYVIVKELIPQSQDNKNWGLIAFFVGFLIMTILDIALG